MASLFLLLLGNITPLTTIQILSVDDRRLTWTIPSFPVMAVDFKRADLMLNGKFVKGLLKFGSKVSEPFPVEVHCSSSCYITIEEEEFLVVWEYSNVADDESTDQESDCDEGELEIESLLEPTNHEAENVIHCLPFKVMGVTYNTIIQDHLEAAKAVGCSLVSAKLEAEPNNQYDSNAIAVFIDYGNNWVKIGYIAKELTRYIHPLLANGNIITVNVKHIKFCIVYMRVGYYITINISKKGQWEDQVIRASLRVK